MSEEKDLEKTELVQSDVEAEKGENETVKTEETVENVEETEVKETEKVEEDKTVEEKPDDSDDQTGELIGETPVAQEMPQNASVPENMGGVAPAIPADKPKKVKKPLSKGAIAGIVAGGVGTLIHIAGVESTKLGEIVRHLLNFRLNQPHIACIKENVLRIPGHDLLQVNFKAMAP